MEELKLNEFKNFLIAPLEESRISNELIKFCDEEMGQDYYNYESLLAAQRKSLKGGLISSFIAYTKSGEVVGVRLSYSPGTWIQEMEKKRKGALTFSKWKVELDSVAYFQSLYVGKEFQQWGLGSHLSLMSIEVLKKQGAKAIVCHSWLPSPGNASQRYLTKLGFRPVKEHLNFWKGVDYSCPACGDGPCVCPALEMIYYL